jgi:hypothetical protein
MTLQEVEIVRMTVDRDVCFGQPGRKAHVIDVSMCQNQGRHVSQFVALGIQPRL